MEKIPIEKQKWLVELRAGKDLKTGDTFWDNGWIHIKDSVESYRNIYFTLGKIYLAKCRPIKPLKLKS